MTEMRELQFGAVHGVSDFSSRLRFSVFVSESTPRSAVRGVAQRYGSNPLSSALGVRGEGKIKYIPNVEASRTAVVVQHPELSGALAPLHLNAAPPVPFAKDRLKRATRFTVHGFDRGDARAEKGKLRFSRITQRHEGQSPCNASPHPGPFCDLLPGFYGKVMKSFIRLPEPLKPVKVSEGDSFHPFSATHLLSSSTTKEEL
ncbi:uncharacterized protein LOC120524454 [Polypterus senegalus]|uniref:uncharacterized protein LOC120524454 n=1 Tax=Polypterus senegalus TaxID=55291 RepID=UPI0019661840|nr:uncharacterized protein LOC120524454 [Polypterus senegalus]